MPPRHGKSTICSECFPAWYLGRYPDKSVILASYEAEYAASWGRKARDMLTTLGPDIFNLQVADDYSARNRWGIEGRAGGMQTAGVGGPLTGKGADILVIDDPIKNDKEANSKVFRDHVHEWYRSVAYTRLEPEGSILLVMTHWHEDDLAGRLIKEMDEGGEEWEILSLPAIATADEDWRDEGESLWPERYDEERMATIRRTVGPYYWLALYQQRPGKEEGTVFKVSDFRYFTVDGDDFVLEEPGLGEILRWPMEDCQVFQTVDTAETDSTKADFTVIMTWALTPRFDLLLLDVVREQLETPDITPLIRAASTKWNPLFVAIEGRPVYAQVRRIGIPVRRLRPDGKSKWTRAQPASARMDSNSIFFLSGAPWLQALEEELIAFPTGANDDQVDALSYAALEVAKGPLRPQGGMTAEVL